MKKIIKVAAHKHAVSVLGKEQAKELKEAVKSISEDFVAGAEFVLNQIKEVSIVSDDDGHDYVLPKELEKQFNKDLQDEELIDSGEFDEKYQSFATGGCISNVKLWTFIAK